MDFFKALALGFIEVAESRGWAAPEAEPAAPATSHDEDEDEDEDADVGFDDDAESRAEEEDDSSIADRWADREAEVAAQEAAAQEVAAEEAAEREAAAQEAAAREAAAREAAAQEVAAQEAAEREASAPRWIDWPFGEAWSKEAAAQEPTIADGRAQGGRARRGLRSRRSRLTGRRRRVSGQRIAVASAAEREDAAPETTESPKAEPQEQIDAASAVEREDAAPETSPGQQIDATPAPPKAKPQDATTLTVVESGESSEGSPPTAKLKPQDATQLAVVESDEPSEGTPPTAKPKPQDAAQLAVVESDGPSEGTPPTAKFKPDYDLSTPRHVMIRARTQHHVCGNTALAVGVGQAANEQELNLLQFVEWVEEHGTDVATQVEAVESTEPHVGPCDVDVDVDEAAGAAALVHDQVPGDGTSQHGVDSTSSTVPATTPSPDDLRARVHALEEEVQCLRAALQCVDERIEATVRAQAGAIVAMFQETLAPLGAIGEQIAEVEKRCVATVDQRVQSVVSGVTTLLHSELSDVDRKIATVVSGATTLLHSELSDVDRKIATVDRRVETVASGVATLLHSELGDVDRRIDEVSAAVANLMGDECDDGDEVDEAFDADEVDEVDEADDSEAGEADPDTAKPKPAELRRRYFSHPLYVAPEVTAADQIPDENEIDPYDDD